ncbi:MAG: ATP-binding cassette domain-containing protein [Sphingomonas sp.]|jgi:hypothetical protein|uniref:ATP-binding cassette domain-containing protein n=1 Tax=Sphingomonas sp. TaxID=28214 RepID=UPI0035658646
MSVLKIRDLRKRYGGKVVLDGVSHRFPTGLTLLVGPSGAGKSTFLRLLVTAEKPSGGQMSWNGAALPTARRTLRRTPGYAPQAVDLPEARTLERDWEEALAAEQSLGASSNPPWRKSPSILPRSTATPYGSCTGYPGTLARGIDDATRSPDHCAHDAACRGPRLIMPTDDDSRHLPAPSSNPA